MDIDWLIDWLIGWLLTGVKKISLLQAAHNDYKINSHFRKDGGCLFIFSKRNENYGDDENTASVQKNCFLESKNF